MVLLCSSMFFLMLFYKLTTTDEISTYEFRELDPALAFGYGVAAAFLSSWIRLAMGLLFRRIDRNRVPALILNGEEGEYKNEDEETEILSPQPLRSKTGLIFGFQKGKPISKPGSSATSTSAGDTLPDEELRISIPDSESKHSVFQIPSTDMLQTENWVSKALALFAKDGNPQHLVHKYYERGEVPSDLSDSEEPSVRFSKKPSNLSSSSVSSSRPKHARIYDPQLSESNETLSLSTESSSKSRLDKRRKRDIPLSPLTPADINSIVESTKAGEAYSKLNKEFKLVEISMSFNYAYQMFLPYNFIFVAWLIACLIISTTLTFTMIYGYNYGFIRSLDWSIALAFVVLSSFFIFEPIIALCEYSYEWWQIKSRIRMTKKELIMKTRFVIIGTEEVRKKMLKIWTLKYQLYLDWAKSAFIPLAGTKIFTWKLDARRKLKARKGVVDVLVFLTYLILLIHIMNVTRDKKNWRNTRIFEEMLLLSKEEHVLRNPNAFMNIKNNEGFYDYLDKIFVPAIHLETDFSGNPVIVDQNRPDIWLSNRNALLLGVAYIRQNRVVHGSDECQRGAFLEMFDYSCDEELSDGLFSSNLETSNFSDGWVKLPKGKNRIFSPTNDLWKYRDSSKSDDDYERNGYIAELGRTQKNSRSVIKHLRLNSWIDTYTREIVIEFTAYNPNVNLYSLVELKMELTQTLTWIPTVKMTSTRFVGGSGDANVQHDSLRYIIFALVFVFCCCYLLYWSVLGVIDRFIRGGLKGIWKDKASLLDLTIPLIGFGILGNFIALFITVTSKLSHLRQQPVNQFVSFNGIQDRNEVQIILYCGSMILCLVKLWRLLLVSSRRFFIIGFTLSQTYGHIFGFILFYVTVLVAFSLFATLNFGAINESFRTITKSFLISVYQTGLGNAFKYYEMSESEPFWGRVLYAAFNIFVIFLFLNVLISTLTLGLQEAKEVSIQRPFRLSYTGYIWGKLQSLLPIFIRKIFAKKEQIVTITAEKSRELEEAFVQILENHITSIEVQRIREMKGITEHLISHKQKLISKKDKMTAKKNKIRKIGEDRLNRMREISIQSIKKTAKLEFSAEEKAKYDEFNNAILRIKCNKLNEKMKQLDQKFQAHFPNYKTGG